MNFNVNVIFGPDIILSETGSSNWCVFDFCPKLVLQETVL